MGRPAQFSRERVLAAAGTIVAERGPAGLTMALLSKRLGAPMGSIYHRYPSRDLLVADLWLRTVDSFQPEFLEILKRGAPLEAAAAAVRFACSWVRRHPQEARLLLLYRREDFMRDPWPKLHRSRAQRLQREGAAGIRAYCRRLYGSVRARDLRRTRFALLDLPLAAVRSSIEVSTNLPADVEQLVQDTCRHVLAGGRNSVAVRGPRTRHA